MPGAIAQGFVSAITRHMFPKLLRDLREIRQRVGMTRVAFNVSAEGPRPGRPGQHGPRGHQRGGTSRRSASRSRVTEGTAVSSDPAVARSPDGAAGRRRAPSPWNDYGVGFSSLRDAESPAVLGRSRWIRDFILRMLRSPKSATLVRTAIRHGPAPRHPHGGGGDRERRGVPGAAPLRGVMRGRVTGSVHRLPLQDYVTFLGEDRRWPCSPVGMLRMAQLTHTWQAQAAGGPHLRLPQASGGRRPRRAIPPAGGAAHGPPGVRPRALVLRGLARGCHGNPDFDALEVPAPGLGTTCCGEILREARGGGGSAATIRSVLREPSSERSLSARIHPASAGDAACFLSELRLIW